MGTNRGKETEPMPKKKSAKKSKLTPKHDSQRETRVLLEQIHSEVKIVAEGHDILNQKLDNVDAKLQGHDVRFDRLEMVAGEHSKDIKELKAGQEEIKQKLDTVTENHEKRIQKLEAVR